MISVSCRKKFEKISTAYWQPKIALPFIQTTITLQDIMPADSNLAIHSDSTLYYAFHQDSIFGFIADSLLHISDTINKSFRFSLGEITVDTFGISAAYSINEALPYINQEARDSLLAHNESENIFPPFNYSTPYSLVFDPIDVYRSLTFSEGYLEIKTQNQLPVTIVNISFDIIDIENNTILKSIQIPQLQSGETFSDTLELRGKTLSNRFSFLIKNFSSSGSYPDSVFINLNKGLSFAYMSHKVKVVGGETKIPQQLMYSGIKTIDLNTENGEKLRQIIFKQGHFRFEIQSELNMDVYIGLSFPTGLLNGQVPSLDTILPANNFLQSTWDVSGMQLNLNSDIQQDYNRFPIQVSINIFPTDQIISFDSSNQIKAKLDVSELSPSFVKGFLGKQTLNFDSDTINMDFDFFNNFQGEIILSDPVMTITYTNSFGLPVKMLASFRGINTSSGANTSLGLDSIPLDYPKTPGQYSHGLIRIDKNNSNIVNFMAVRPDKIVYKGGILTNWNKDSLNFIYDTSHFVANVDLIVPLTLSINKLIFFDTAKIVLSNQKEFPLQSGILKAKVANGFPLNMKLQLILFDSVSGQQLDSISFGEITAAPTNENGRVTQLANDSLFVNFDKTFIENFKNANKAIFKVETSGGNHGSTPVTLYSYYTFKLAIGFVAKIKP